MVGQRREKAGAEARWTDTEPAPPTHTRRVKTARRRGAKEGEWAREQLEQTHPPTAHKSMGGGVYAGARGGERSEHAKQGNIKGRAGKRAHRLVRGRAVEAIEEVGRGRVVRVVLPEGRHKVAQLHLQAATRGEWVRYGMKE